MTSVDIKTIAKSCLDILVATSPPEDENDIRILTFEPSDELNNSDHGWRVQIDKIIYHEDGDSEISYELSDHTQDGTMHNDINLLEKIYKNIEYMEKEIGPVVRVRVQVGETNIFDLKLETVLNKKQKQENMVIDKVLDIFETYDVPSLGNIFDRAAKRNNPNIIEWFLSDDKNDIINMSILRKYVNK